MPQGTVRWFDAERGFGFLSLGDDAEDLFGKETVEFLAALRKSPVAPGFDKLRIAGDPERETRAKRERDGISVDDNTWKEIQAAASKVKLPPEKVDALARS